MHPVGRRGPHRAEQSADSARERLLSAGGAGAHARRGTFNGPQEMEQVYCEHTSAHAARLRRQTDSSAQYVLDSPREVGGRQATPRARAFVTQCSLFERPGNGMAGMAFKQVTKMSNAAGFVLGGKEG